LSLAFDLVQQLHFALVHQTVERAPLQTMGSACPTIRLLAGTGEPRPFVRVGRSADTEDEAIRSLGCSLKVDEITLQVGRFAAPLVESDVPNGLEMPPVDLPGAGEEDALRKLLDALVVVADEVQSDDIVGHGYLLMDRWTRRRRIP
jgi:hypothetical protein